MNKTLIPFLLFFCMNLLQAHTNDSIHDQKHPYEQYTKSTSEPISEITHEQWVLFCDIISFTRDTDFITYAKSINPKKYQSSNSTDYIQLEDDDAQFYNIWLTKHGKDNKYFQQVLQEIENCPPPTSSSLSVLCSALMTPEQVTSENSIGYNYQNALWELACAKPKIDPTEVGRVKVRRYWNKYKKEIVNPLGRNGRIATDTDGLNVAKYAIDGSGIRFVRELAIAYRVDFNFADEKDGLTVLDFVQKRIYQAKRKVPLPEAILLEYEAVYRDVVRAGGKHSENWLQKRESYK